MSLPLLREYARKVYRGFEDDDLLTYASAISFRVFFSIVPLLLFGFALLGFFNLDDI